jgi:hypothetical protein
MPANLLSESVWALMLLTKEFTLAKRAISKAITKMVDAVPFCGKAS